VNALVWLVPVAIALGAVFVILFLLAVRSGQFDDLDDPPHRILKDDD
jgi:cbb3-type cytochrome oxidase maturation protein